MKNKLFKETYRTVSHLRNINNNQCNIPKHHLPVCRFGQGDRGSSCIKVSFSTKYPS